MAISLDNGESVYQHTGTDSADMVTAINALASSVANLMKNRERFDYTWANATERGTQTGMVQGSRGYQEDTKTEYLYDSSVWRLALPYAEFTASQSLATGSNLLLGVFSIDAANSTDQAFVVPGTSGLLTLVNPGVYSVYSVTDMGSTMDLAGSLDLRFTSVGGTMLNRQPLPIGEFIGGNTAPAVRTTAGNVQICFIANKQTVANPSTLATRVRIARLG